MDYQSIVRKCEDNAYLISMVPVEELIRFGYSIGLNESSRVLDLCCGYGTVLKIWSEAFGITGVGVDLCDDFLSIGRERLKQAGIDKIDLKLDDVTVYADTIKYDVVICSETKGTIAETLALGEKFLKDHGILAYQKLYSKVQIPPQELVDFDYEVLPLSELYKEFKKLGYYITNMASDSDSSWEHYIITWSGKRDIEDLRKNPDNIGLENWIDKWYRMYFDYRRQYEGQALFGLERF
jgi:cyclopropane fatty-acyl-phospholipid synthase-like methyltransferase